MFKLVSNPEFKRTVPVNIPDDNGTRREEFTANFRLIGVAALAAADTLTPEGTTKFLNAVVVSCEDLQDEAGKPLNWNDKVRDQLFDFAPARRALLSAYEAGLREASEKN